MKPPYSEARDILVAHPLLDPRWPFIHRRSYPVWPGHADLLVFADRESNGERWGTLVYFDEDRGADLGQKLRWQRVREKVTYEFIEPFGTD